MHLDSGNAIKWLFLQELFRPMIIKILRYLASFGDQKNRLYREINEMRRLTQGVRKDLIPLENDEIINISTYRYLGKRAYGTKPTFFTTVFNETIGAKFEKSIGKTGDKITVIYTHAYEMAFVSSGGSLELFVNENPAGKMNAKGVFFDLSLKAAGKWVHETGKKLRMLQMGSHACASVQFNDRNALTDRMYSDFVYDTEEEKILLLAFSLYERLNHPMAKK